MTQQQDDEQAKAGEARLAAEEATDEDDFIDLRGIESSVGERLLGWPDGPLQKVVDKLLELRARQLHLQMLGPGLISGDER